ncbi:unnamed protein product, partial [Phaeothamnion confervicola]
NRGLSPFQRKIVEKAILNMKVETTHRGAANRKYRVGGLTREGTADLEFPDKEGGPSINVARYFQQKYHVLQYPRLQCLRIGARKQHNYLPMEVCNLVGGQRVNKLDERQTADMIKITCQKPHIRRAEIHTQFIKAHGASSEWNREFGINVPGMQVALDGRVLEAPSMRYGPASKSGDVERAELGAWNMRDKHFFEPKELACWGVVCFVDKNMFPPDAMSYAVSELARVAKAHGINVSMPKPPTMYASDVRGARTVKDVLERCKITASNTARKACQLIVVMKATGDSGDYGDIKRAGDTALGVPTQCMILKHLRNPNVQYLANVCLKINAKLGGKNTVPATDLPFINQAPTIIFGADVNHPGAGNVSKPSLAAVVGTMDRFASRHAAAIRVQEHRKEVIGDLSSMVKELLLTFYALNGLKPARILFYRDGVSEGQFKEVLQFEVRAIEAACRSLEAGYRPTITFIVCQKRHHTRLFALDRGAQDRSGNVLPGTVVDSAICHPLEFDFYLCSHAGLQGTSRPAHYHVLWDENRFTPEAIQRLTYHLTYFFCRCTRSVSIVPAVYYAHLVAFRAQFFVKDTDESTETDSITRSEGKERDARDIDWAATFNSVHENIRPLMYFV